jgi:hypothetical protein
MSAGVKLGYILININDQQVLFDSVFILEVIYNRFNVGEHHLSIYII